MANLEILNSKKLFLEIDLGELARAREEVKTFVAGSYSPREVNRMVLALDEAIANVIEHAKTEEEEKNLELTLEMLQTPDHYLFILEDNGEVFDPTEQEKLDLDKHAREKPDGGLGVFLLTTLMDAKHEIRPGGGNRLRLSREYKK